MPSLTRRDRWNFEPLAAQCKKHNRWTFFVTSAPLHIPGGIGSRTSMLPLPASPLILGDHSSCAAFACIQYADFLQRTRWLSFRLAKGTESSWSVCRCKCNYAGAEPLVSVDVVSTCASGTGLDSFPNWTVDVSPDDIPLAMT
jgi:hypothetical protein